MPLVLDQPGEQPIGRKASVQQQQIIGAHLCQRTGQHLPFPGTRGPHVRMDKQTTGHVHETKDLGQGYFSAPTIPMHAKLINNLRQGRQTQGCGIPRQQSKAMPARHCDALLPSLEQQVIEGDKGRWHELLAGLGERAFGNSPYQLNPIGKATEEIVQFALQTPRHAAGQTGDQGGEAQGATTGEISRARPVGGNEFVRLEGGADFSQQCGMEVAKSFSCILLNNNNFAVSILPRTGLNLTALDEVLVHPCATGLQVLPNHWSKNRESKRPWRGCPLDIAY